MKSKSGMAVGPLLSIVDDDASMRNSMRRLIRSFGIRAEAFASGREFLGSGLVEDTVCLILDVRMPGMDGLELQTLLADNHHRIPVVFVSAYADAEEQRRAMQAGALDFLRKPVRQEALMSAIQVVLRRNPQDGKHGVQERNDS
jgi:FixJ family two-component response regulator